MSEKQTKPIVLITFAVILFGLIIGPAFTAESAVIQFNEFQITSNTASQENPDIDGIRIVYQDNRNGNWDIYIYTLQGVFEPETRITSHSGNQVNPKISADKIVYADDRNGNWDIYMYDLTTQTETRITDNAFAQEFPAIDGNRIVWQDNRNGLWDIYVYDLSTQTETRVTNSGSNTFPAISGSRIAYIKNGDMYYFDLSGGNEIRLTAYNHDLSKNTECPGIYGSRIVWSVENSYPMHSAPWLYSWKYDVYMRDVVTGAMWDTHADSIDQMCPDISELQPGEYYIVNQIWNSPYWNINLYYTGTQTQYRVTNIAANQLSPKVSGGRIVYMDYRNGNWDIYMTMVSYVAGGSEPPTPGISVQQIEGIKTIISDPAQIPASDIEGPNSKAKENRRSALLKRLDAVIAGIQAGGYRGAIGHLNSILDKTDGCALRGAPDGTGTGFTPDWIITCASQELIEPLISDSITMLETLLQQD
jgi:beta propeller repeat protein